MPAPDTFEKTVVRFPSERRLAPTIASLEKALPFEGLLRVKAERRGCRKPHAGSDLRAFGRERAGFYLAKLALPSDLGERRQVLCEWLAPNIGRALARIADARALPPGPESVDAETLAWETAQNILGAYEAVEHLMDGAGTLSDGDMVRRG